MIKYLTPDGKQLSKHDLGMLSMKQIFTLLIDLNVASKTLYNEYRKVNEPVTRTRTRSRSRSRSRQPSLIIRHRFIRPRTSWFGLPSFIRQGVPPVQQGVPPVQQGRPPSHIDGYALAPHRNRNSGYAPAPHRNSGYTAPPAGGW